MFANIQAAWDEVLKFMDKVVGWILYVVGAEDDPYSYDGFYGRRDRDNTGETTV